MKLPQFQRYWNCLTSLVVLSPSMQWARNHTIAQQIYTAKAEYILSLKANHPTLFHQVETWFETTRAADNLPTAVHHTTEAGHHRTERRTVWTVPVDQLPPLHQAEEWVGLQTLVVVERTRYLWNKTTHEIQFYLTSLPAESPKIATAIRQHWGIENSLHAFARCHLWRR